MRKILEVTTEAENRQLVTVEKVKTELGITWSDLDSYLGELVDEASAQIESYCARTFARQEYLETVRLDSFQATLVLSVFPVVVIDSVTEAGEELTVDDGFESNTRAGIIYRLSAGSVSAWLPAEKIAVTYTAGYYLPGDSVSPAPSASEVLPADVQRVALELVKMRYASRDRDPTVSRESIPDVIDVSYRNVSAGQAIPLELAAALDAYRAQVFA